MSVKEKNKQCSLVINSSDSKGAKVEVDYPVSPDTFVKVLLPQSFLSEIKARQREAAREHTTADQQTSQQERRPEQRPKGSYPIFTLVKK
jgi:hypothetical protein